MIKTDPRPRVIRNSGSLTLHEDGHLVFSDWHVDCDGQTNKGLAIVDAIVNLLLERRNDIGTAHMEVRMPAND